jgi:signal transduction histidine kinase
MLNQETRREYLSEAFHSLSQPLTALQCGLELAVAVPRSQKEYERRLGDALQSTGSLREMMSALRELVEAEDPGEDAREVELGELLSSLRDSLNKLAQLYESGLAVQSPEQITVCASQEKLSRLLLFLAEQVVAREATLRVEAERVGRKVEIRIETDGKRVKKEADGRTWRERVREIRMNAADNYIATLGGVLRASEAGYEIELPRIGS